MEKKEMDRIDGVCDAMDLSVKEIRKMMKKDDAEFAESSGQIPIQACLSRNNELEKVITKTIEGLGKTKATFKSDQIKQMKNDLIKTLNSNDR